MTKPDLGRTRDAGANPMQVVAGVIRWLRRIQPKTPEDA